MIWLLRRFGVALLLVWLVASIVFLAIHMVPGDPAELLLSQGGAAPDPTAVAQLREQLGLDQPLAAQYLGSVEGLLHGNLGDSLEDGSPVGAEILLRLPRTLELIGMAAVMALATGVPLGLLAALRRGGVVDRLVSLLAAVGLALPVFVLGTLMVLLFAQTLHWTAAGGYVPLAQSPLRHFARVAMPAAAIAVGLFGTVFRMTRAAVLDVSLARLCAHRAGKGPAAPPRADAARAAQCDDAGRHGCRSQSRHPAGRHSAGRIRLQLSRPVGDAGRCGQRARLSLCPRDRASDLDPVRQPELTDGPDLRGARSAHPAGLSMGRTLRLLPFVALAMIVLTAIAVPLLPLPSPLAMDVAHRLSPPSTAHWLGQDEYGRDVLARLLWGAQASLLVAGGATVAACVLGTLLGIAGGLFGALAELLAVRSMDIVLCFPPLLLALLVVTLLGPGVLTLIPVLALVYLPGFVRVAYAGVLSVRSQDYVEAVRLLGAGPARIVLRTVLPNIAGPLLVQISLAASSAVVLESGLSFLGLGVVPPAASWGLMIASARTTMAQAPWLLLWPCLALTLTILVLNAICDTLRDIIDPHGVPPRRRGVLAALAPGLLPAPNLALEVRGLSVAIDTPAGPIAPVREISIAVRPGETLAIVGESGSGKSLLGLAVMGLLPPPARATAGAVWVDGQAVLHAPEDLLRRLRGSRMAMVFQDPLSSLNPVHRIGRQIEEALRAHRRISPRAAAARAIALLRHVGIPDPERRAQALPFELSGGMRQRAMIAMAVANDPRLLIADEPTTALDVTIQAQVLDLLAALKREGGMGLVFITHSLPVVAEIADHVAVMYAGEIVEQGAAAAVFAAPRHPYTAALLRSAPSEDGGLPEGVPGIVPPLHALPPGCVFAPRCAHRRAACEAAPPPLVPAGPGRLTRCIRWTEIAAGTPVSAGAMA